MSGPEAESVPADRVAVMRRIAASAHAARRRHAVIGAAVIGSGNIGTDLMIKLLRSAVKS